MENIGGLNECTTVATPVVTGGDDVVLVVTATGADDGVCPGTGHFTGAITGK